MTAASKLRAATVCIGAALAVLLLVATVQPASAREDAATLRSEAEAQVRKLQTEVETRYEDVFASGENYAGCTLRDSCGLHNNPPPGWITGPSPWRNSTTCPVNADTVCPLDISYNEAVVKYPAGVDRSSTAVKDALCVTAGLSSKMADRGGTGWVNYQYYGDQSTGLFVDYPAHTWDASMAACPGAFDPRFRPWYAGAATGPKDVVVVIDVSGSMGNFDRMTLAKTAAKEVLKTLRQSDYATIVTFSTGSESASANMLAMSDTNKATLNTYIDNLIPGGRTNFEDGFRTAFGVLESSRSNNARSGCFASVILFLTDGEITVGETGDDLLATIKGLNNVDLNTKIMTYSLGADADKSIMKQIACQNEGIWYEIADDAGNSLRNKMASYYEYLTAGIDTTVTASVRWSETRDVLTSNLLMAACLPVFDRTKTPHDLFGVVCVDINVDRLTVATNGASEKASMEATSLVCPQLSLTESMLETLRKRESGEAAVCAEDTTADGSSALIAIVVVVVVVVIAVVILVCCCLARSGKKKKPNANGQGGSNGKATSTPTPAHAPAPAPAAHHAQQLAAYNAHAGATAHPVAHPVQPVYPTAAPAHQAPPYGSAPQYGGQPGYPPQPQYPQGAQPQMQYAGQPAQPRTWNV